MQSLVLRGCSVNTIYRAADRDPMRLVLLPPSDKDQAEPTLPDELRPVLATLRELLREPGDLLPADDDIVVRQWPRDAKVDPKQVPGLLRRLVALGVLRKVVLGREVHLCLAANTGAVSLPQASPDATPDGAGPAKSETHDDESSDAKTAEQRLFQLQMIADVETERVLLFRVGIVLELLFLLTLLRQIVLWYLAL